MIKTVRSRKLFQSCSCGHAIPPLYPVLAHLLISTLLTVLTSICGAKGQCSMTGIHSLTCNDPDGAGLAGPPAVSTNVMPGRLC